MFLNCVFVLREQQGEPETMTTFLWAALGKSVIAGLLLISEYSELFIHIFFFNYIIFTIM